MNNLTHAAWFGLLLTLGVWELSMWLFRRRPSPLLNPVAVTVVVVIAVLLLLNVDYAAYNEGGKWLSFLLGPAVVALAVPLVRQIEQVKSNLLAILVSLVCGAVTGIVSAVGLVALCHGSKALAMTLAPKSVTTPIAIGIAEKIGGVPPLAAAVVVLTGILGSLLGPELMRWLGIRSPLAQGLGLGAAAHGIGTARALREGPLMGGMSGIAMTLNGLLTAVLMPVLLPWLERWF